MKKHHTLKKSETLKINQANDTISVQHLIEGNFQSLSKNYRTKSQAIYSDPNKNKILDINSENKKFGDNQSPTKILKKAISNINTSSTDKINIEICSQEVISDTWLENPSTISRTKHCDVLNKKLILRKQSVNSSIASPQTMNLLETKYRDSLHKQFPKTKISELRVLHYSPKSKKNLNSIMSVKNGGVIEQEFQQNVKKHWTLNSFETNDNKILDNSHTFDEMYNNDKKLGESNLYVFNNSPKLDKSEKKYISI